MRMMRDNWRATGLTILVLGALGLSVPAASAQQQQEPGQQQPQGQSGAPIPAYRSPLISDDNSDTGDNSQEPSPDTRPLAGTQNLALSGLETKRSFWQPHFAVSAAGDSNARQNTNNATWSTWTSFAGGVDAQKISSSSQMSVGYTGGFMYSNDRSMPDGIVQQFNFADTLEFRRATLTILDDFSYLPEQRFGFGGLGGVPLPGGVSTGLGPGLVPSQSVLSGHAQSLINSYVTQLDVSATSRSSVTFAGGYSVVHYLEGNLLDTREITGRVGYNYQLSRRDTVALLYNFQEIAYSGSLGSINNHITEVSYGRRITGRLAFQISGGPEVTIFHTPISSTATTSTQLSWAMSTALQYELRRNHFGLDYSHGVSGGSGVLLGSATDTASGALVRRMSRTFNSGITAGFAHNRGLPTAANPTNQHYNYWFTGATLSHPWGRTVGVTLSYQMQYQNSNIPFCISSTCGTKIMRHVISFGLDWRERPLLF